MKYADAFRKLGYTLQNVRQDWSAVNDKGVCISIWKSEMKTRDGLTSLDTRTDAGPIEVWGSLPGGRKRLLHLREAQEKFNGILDEVLVEGTPGKGVTDADPWISGERANSKWHLTYLDPETGRFAAAPRKL